MPFDTAPPVSSAGSINRLHPRAHSVYFKRRNLASKKSAIRFIVAFGLISLFADVTYEGARGIIGPYLASLGAGAFAVGFVSGLGEMVGYALRLASGYIADKTRSYWALTIVGYMLNLIAVPLLAVAGSWPVAAVLIVLERTGK